MHVAERVMDTLFYDAFDVGDQCVLLMLTVETEEPPQLYQTRGTQLR